MPPWIYWALVTPVVVAITRRWPPIGAGWVPRALLHVLAATVVHLGASAVTALPTRIFASGELRLRPIGEIFSGYAVSRWPFHVLIYAAIAGAFIALDAWRRLREREVHASRLEAQLARAQLAALRMQLHPHFLFNTLQAISVLTVENPRSAQHMLTLLGDLLRAVLEGGDQQEVPLADEVHFVRRYLEIEQVRFGDRLDVRFDIPPDAGELLVPGFILQPLVENAIRHGVAPRAAAGRIEIEARAQGGTLELAVRDNGAGVAPGAEDGVGLSTTRARLEKLYGTAQRFVLRPRDGGGTEAMIAMPSRVAS
jgi:LytS/YehU family sensor histidine kinase